MNFADLAILVVIAISVLLGLWRGFVVEVMSLAVWAAAVVFTFIFGGRVGEWFSQAIELPSARIALGHLLVFVAVLMVGAVLIFVVRKLVASTGLSGTDRMLGMAFGLVRGAAIVVLLVLLMGLTPFPRDAWWRESRALPAFLTLAQQVAPYLPAALREHLNFSGSESVSPTPPPAGSAPSTAA